MRSRAIHTPGSIQPHGLLLVVDLESARVVGAAGSFGRLLGTRQQPFGRPLRDVLGIESAR
jgi:light-regulated signal transduction histidine kinase (bacteriophytochrome)